MSKKTKETYIEYYKNINSNLLMNYFKLNIFFTGR